MHAIMLLESSDKSPMGPIEYIEEATYFWRSPSQ